MNVIHGGLDEGELRSLGIDPASVLDLSANLHPAGPSEAVLAAARAARFDRYPPADAGALRDAIARHEGIPTASVLPTPGATAAIHLIARAFLRPDDRAAILEPAFGEYRAATEATGGCIEAVPLAPPAFTPPRALPDATLTFIANPNNPTGSYLERPELERWLSPSRLLVVDAAYEAFVPGGWDAVDLVRDGANVAVVRSMTKLHAIPGIRLGYVVGPAEVIARLERLQPSWSLDAVAHAAGPVALAEHPRRVEQLTATWAARDRLRAALEGAGLELGPSRANFLLVRVGDAAAARSALLALGILVRDCASFGLPEWIRVAVPRVEDEPPVREALLAVLGAR